MRELSLHVMDIVQNSLSAGASLTEISVTEEGANMAIEIKDNGRGMSQEQVKSVVDPFFTTRTTRKVGLGVPLFKMAAEQTGGSFSISSEVGVGTRLAAAFQTASVDMIPLGDINSTISLLIRCNPDRDFLFRRAKDGREFTLDTRELRQVLGEDVPLDAPEVMEWIDAYLAEQTESIFGGAISNEIIRGTQSN